MTAFRTALCSVLGHRWFTYTEATYKDCTRCGISSK